jgi:signal peptidase II
LTASDDDGTRVTRATGGRRTGRRGDLIGLGVVVLVVALDQLTKWWALESFEWSPRHVVWTLQLVVAHNSGAAFSLFSGRGIGPAIALLAVVVVVVVVRTLRFVQGWPAIIGSALVVGGALGNLADRLFRSHGAGFLQGAVVDWIDFGWWPVFNVADMAITTGAVTLGFAAFFAPRDDDPDGGELVPTDQDRSSRSATGPS